MKRIAPAVLALLLSSCQTPSYEPPVRDYPALAAAAVGKYTITDNDVYGLHPEEKLDPKFAILASRREGDWTVDTVADKRSGFDRVEVTLDSAGTIVRLRFLKLARSTFARQDTYNTIYRELKSKYKAVQTLGDLDTAELTVNVAASAEDWTRHYIEYLQLMDEPNNLGAQFCWILHPHLSLIQAMFRRGDTGTSVVVDYQTKKYAAALAAAKAAAASSSQAN
jgi:hypothetical protein